MAYTLQKFTVETGEQAIVPVLHGEDVTVVVSGANGVDEVDIQVVLDNPDKSVVIRTTVETDVLTAKDTITKTLEGPVQGIGINIITNVSNDIKAEVLSAFRGG